MLDSKNFKKWLVSTDSHGNRMVADWERPAIIDRLKEVEKTLKVVEGDLTKDQPNRILIDITHLKPKGFQPTKKVITTLAHFIRPCPCDRCDHESQYECYLADCSCCSDECT